MLSLYKYSDIIYKRFVSEVEKMVVLTAIGRFFKKIWDWIKQTAWIQPLLIVGVIFGVIFSIPSIVNAVKNGKKEKSAYAAYYHSFKLSLQGGKDSEADKFTDDLFEVMSEGKVDTFKENYPQLGTKFFVAYVAKDCTGCESAKEGFSYFEENFENYGDKGETLSDKFMVTIFTDDETEETDDSTAFVKYLQRHEDFFQEVGSRAGEMDYWKDRSDEDNKNLDAMSVADPDDFMTPTIYLVELGDQIEAPGVTEIVFGISGSSKTDKALQISDMWRHRGDFSNDSND